MKIKNFKIIIIIKKLDKIFNMKIKIKINIKRLNKNKKNLSLSF